MLELAGEEADAGLGETLEALLADAYEAGAIEDAAIAASEAQAAGFWRLRENLSEAQLLEGGSIKHDIAVPVSAVPAFLARALPLVEGLIPGVRPVPFGHLGDGNLHFNLSRPAGADSAPFLALGPEVNAAVYRLLEDMGGTISAEHGIGQLKRDALKGVKSPVELDLMTRLKAALDPTA